MLRNLSRLRQVSGQHVVQSWDVSGALNAAMAAHRHYATARTASIALQQLDDARASDHLHASRMLRPADRIDECAGTLAARIAAQQFRDIRDGLRTASAYGRVSGV